MKRWFLQSLEMGFSVIGNEIADSAACLDFGQWTTFLCKRCLIALLHVIRLMPYFSSKMIYYGGYFIEKTHFLQFS